MMTHMAGDENNSGKPTRPLVLDIFRKARYGKVDRRKCKRVVPMKILCFGLSKTGTQSLRQSLFDLGYDDVYHQTSINVDNPPDAEMWIAAFQAKFENIGKPFERKEWDQLLGHCMAALDVPCVTFWKELMDAYPEAQIILTLRDGADIWYQSFMESIMRPLGALYGNGWLAFIRSTLLREQDGDRYAKQLLKYDFAYGTCFRDYLNNTRNSRECYENHNDEVLRRAKDQNREVLVYNVKQGWGPLCKFLDVREPNAPFPRLNEKAYFQRGTTKLQVAVMVGAVMQTIMFVLPAVAIALLFRYWPLSE